MDLLANFPPGLGLFGLACLKADLEGILGCGVQLLRQRAELGRGEWLVDQHGMIGRCVSTRDLPDVLPNPGLARAPRPQQRR